jgi:hypothetical protein
MSTTCSPSGPDRSSTPRSSATSARGLFTETVPATADADIFAWRQLAWDNAQRLLASPTDKARDRIARQIRRHAKDKAHEILGWYR